MPRKSMKIHARGRPNCAPRNAPMRARERAGSPPSRPFAAVRGRGPQGAAVSRGRAERKLPMIMRLVHVVVVAALVVAAIDVYTIKFESTVRAEHLAKLAAEIKRERDTIAALRAEWALLDNPARI